MDSKFKVEQLLDKINILINNQTTSKEELITIAKIMMNEKWNNWALALFLIIDDQENISKIIRK